MVGRPLEADISPKRTQVVILAGGLGTRLLPLTRDVPKILAPVAGEPFLFHLLGLLEGQGFARFVFVLGHLGSMVRQTLESSGRVRPNYQTVLLDKPEEYGTGGALKAAETLCHDTFVLVYGDTYLDIDYWDLLRSFYRREALVSMVVYDNSDGAFRGNIAIGQNDLVKMYNKSSGSDLPFVDAGVAVMRRKVFDEFPRKAPFSYELVVLPKLAEKEAVLAYRTSSRFYDIGSHEGLFAFSEFLRRRWEGQQKEG